MKIYSTNPLDDITLTASTTATGYSVRNVQNISLAKKWRPVGVVSANVVGQMIKGYQELGLSSKTAGTETGLSGSTTYYFKVATDDNNLIEYDIETATDTTFAALLELLNAATTGISTWSLKDGDLRNTSDTYGPDSTIRMLAGQAADLFVTLTDFTAFEPSVYGSGIALPTIAILDGHNLTIDAVVKIQGNNTNAWNTHLIDRGDCESTTAPMIDGETVPDLSNATFVRDGAQKHAGSYSYKIGKGGVGPSLVSLTDNDDTDDMHGLTAGHTYTWDVWVYLPTAGGIAIDQVYLHIRDYDGGWTITTSNSPTSLDTWQKLTVTRTIRAAATGVVIYISVGVAGDASTYLNVDDIELVDDSIVDITMIRGTNDIYYAIAGFSEKEWWRYLIEDPSNTAGYVEFGRLWLGDEIIITGAAKATKEVRPDTTVKSFSRSGQVYSDTGYRYRSYDVNFPYWNNVNKIDIETFINNVRGAPFYVAFDEANIALMPLLYAVLGEDINYTNISALAAWNGTLNFREVK